MAYTVGQTEVDVFPNAKGWDSALAAQIDPQVEAIGKRIGDQLAKKIRESLGEGVGTAPVDAPAREQGGRAGDAFGDAFKKRVRAALANLPDANVKLEDAAAQAKLDQLRAELKDLSGKRIGIDISDADALARVEAIKAKIDELGRESASVRVKVDTAAASLELDRFFAATKIKAEDTGDSVGKNISGGAAKSAKSVSPLIAAAVAGGLIAGAPAVLAGAGVMFAGVAAAAVHSNAQVQAAFNSTKTSIESTFTNAAQVTVPFFVSAMNRIGAAVTALGPQFHSAFAALGAPIDSLTTGLIALANNAMPGIVAAVRSAGPVFQGLASLMASIGTGLGQMFQIISEHSAAAGSVLAELGQILGSLLPILGQLVGAGAELGSAILPPLVAVLHGVGAVLNTIAPVLPAVLAGFLGFKAISTLPGILEKFGSAGQTASSALTGMGKALPAIGIAVGVVGAAFEMQSQQVHNWAQAMLDGGNAASQAQVQIQKLTAVANLLSSGGSGLIANLTGYGTALHVTAQSGSKAAATAKELYDAMSPLQQRQQDVTKATNDYISAVQKHGAGSLQAAEASQALTTAQSQLAGQNAVVSGALQGDAHNLSAIAQAAGAASTQISQMKTSLDILTGATVSTLDAEAAFTQAVDSAKTATQNQKGALVDASGALNTHSAAGAAAEQALHGMASAANGVISAMISQGATAAQVTQRDGELRGSFIQTAQNMGFTAGQASNLADQIYGIPSQRSTTISTDISQAASQIDLIRAKIAGIPNRTVYVNTVYNAGPANYQVPGAGTGGYASGGIAIPMATGGIMAAGQGVANFYPPNTPRLIGDNISVPEAYIPINNSARSLAILGETAARMGLGLASGATGASGPAQFTGNLYLDSGEFLGKVYGVAAQATADYADTASTRGRFNPR